MEMAPEECVLCGGTDRSLLLSEGEWTVHKCAGCGLGFLDPRPDPAELGQLYRESYFVSHYENVLAPGSDGMRRRLSQERHRVEFFRKHRRSGRVLDIGCGRGYFLQACRLRGYDVVGFDVSEDAAASVRDTLGIPVKTGEFRKELFAPGSIDVVTLWHALEHTPDPRVPLDLAREWLSPDGILVVEVPNHEGTDARKLGAKWGDWDLPFHLYHFNPSALFRLLDQCGFSVLRMKRYHSKVVKERIAKLPGLGIIARPISQMFSGSGIAVLATRKSG